MEDMIDIFTVKATNNNISTKIYEGTSEEDALNKFSQTTEYGVIELEKNSVLIKMRVNVPPTQIDPSGKPHNKFLERKFLIAIVAPVLFPLLARLQLTAFGNEYLELAVDAILYVGAVLIPTIWVWIEGKLDQKKIEQQTAVTVQTLKNENSEAQRVSDALP